MRRSVCMSSINRQIRRFQVAVVQWTSKKCTSKRDARAERLFWSLNLLFFWSRRCGRRRLGCFKLPNLPICTDCFTCMRFSILLGTTVPTILAALGLRKMHPGIRGRVQKFVMLESIRGFIHYYYFLANNSWITTQQLNNSINKSLNYHWNISKCLETS